jgi:RNA polymerase sigma factor (sigma-70 family)
VEASALQAPASLSRSRISLGAPLLCLRSDEQLVELFRAGHDEAFRAIHDRYRARLFAYTRQMLPGSRQDAEDALQDVFVRAYAGLRANDRDLALRAWLYRVAHNRCIDELRRPAPPAPELIELVRAPVQDPIAEAERRESLRRLIDDVRRLPEQQRSALLMRELAGMSYAELAAALAVSIPAVKSLLVRARVSLAAAAEARDTACSEIRDELIVAHDRRVRPNAMARRHLRDCAGCREFRTEMRGVSRQFAALVPGLGPMALLANSLGIGGGAGGSAAAGSSAAVAGTGGAFAASGLLGTGISHVATLLAAALVTTGGAIELQSALGGPARHAAHHHAHAGATNLGSGLGAAAKNRLLAVASHGSQSQAAASTPAQTSATVAPAASAAAATSASVAPRSAIDHVKRSVTRSAKQLAIDNGAASAAAAAATGLDTLPPPDSSQTGNTTSSTPTSSPSSTGSTTATGPSSTTGSTTPSTGGDTSATTGESSSGGAGSSPSTPTGSGSVPSTSGASATNATSGGSATSPTR